MLLRLDPQSPVALFRQLRDRISALIEDGALRPGERLPSTRRLAEFTGVHRSTVVEAYGELHALGYIESRAGSYTTVRRRASPAPRSRREPSGGGSQLDWSRVVVRTAARALAVDSSPATLRRGEVDFESLKADPTLAPGDELRRTTRAALARVGAAAFDYADPRGYPPLRETLARRLRAQGVAVEVDELLVTSGAQPALDLVLRALVARGDHVVVEAPTYGGMHALLALHGARPLEIPMREDGMDLQVLERVLRRHRPRLVYTMPSFHNPTGVTTGSAHRERLLAICAAARTPILEDGFEEEMKCFGEVAPPIKAFDGAGVSIYVGTFSKLVFPGLRIGWIAAPRPFIEQVAPMLHASQLSVATVSQLVAHHFSSSGDLDAHLRRIHRVYRRRMLALARALDEHLPGEIERTRPTGGYVTWLTLPRTRRTESEWLERLDAAGLRLAPGSRFFARPPDRVSFRVSIACVDEPEIERGCRRLGSVFSSGLAGARR